MQHSLVEDLPAFCLGWQGQAWDMGVILKSKIHAAV